MDRRSLFAFGGQTLATRLPVRAWTPTDRTIGGARIAASGAPAAYVVRRDSMLALTIRCYEDEWAAVAELVAWGQSAEPITWAPDADDPGTTVEVYLDSPLAGETFSPERDGNFPRVFELAIVLRGKGGISPWTPYFVLS